MERDGEGLWEVPSSSPNRDRIYLLKRLNGPWLMCHICFKMSFINISFYY